MQKTSFFSLLSFFETKRKNVLLATLLLKQNVLSLPRKDITPYFLPHTPKHFPLKTLFPKTVSFWGTKGPYPKKARPDKKTRNLSPKGDGKNLSPKGDGPRILFFLYYPVPNPFFLYYPVSFKKIRILPRAFFTTPGLVYRKKDSGYF